MSLHFERITIPGEMGFQNYYNIIQLLYENREKRFLKPGELGPLADKVRKVESWGSQGQLWVHR